MFLEGRLIEERLNNLREGGYDEVFPRLFYSLLLLLLLTLEKIFLEKICYARFVCYDPLMNDAIKYGKRRIIRHINACGFVIFPSVKKNSKKKIQKSENLLEFLIINRV